MPTSGSISNSEFIHREDTANSSGDQGAFVLGVRNDAATVTTTTDGDYSQISTDSAGRIGISDLGGSITIDGTIELGAVTLAALETITVLQGTSPWVVSGTVTVNQGTSPWVTSLDAASLAALESITVQNGAGAAAVNIQDGGNSITVDGTVTVNQGTSPWVTSLDAASLAALESITVQNGAGAAAVNIQDGGNSITVDGTVSVSGTVTTGDNKTEDLPHASGDIGSFALGVRNDTAAVRTTTDGDYSPLSTDSAGRLGISDLGGSISIDDNGGSITVDGTVTVTQGTSPWITSLDAASLAALESITVQNGAGAGAVNIQDGGNSITVDGTVTVTQGTSPWVTSLDAASLAALESITVQNGAGAAAVNIQDGGNSITVDGTVTADTNFDFAEDVPHVSGDIGAFVLAVRNDANTVMTNTNGDYSPIAVNANGAVAINDGGNSITVDGTVAISGTVAVTQSTSPWVVSGTVTANQGTSPWVTSLDAASLAALESITVQNGAGAAAVNIQDGGNSITVDGTVSITAGTGRDDTDNQAAVATGLNTNVVRTYIWDAAGTNWDRWTGGVTVLNAAGAAAVNIQDGGNSITVDGTVAISGTVAVTQSTSPWVVQAGSERAEDSGHTSGQIGNFVLAVRNDAGTSLVDTTLDYAPLQVDATGALRVVGATITTGRDDTDNQASVSTGLNTNVVRNYIYDGANWDRWTGAVTVTGTVAVTQSTSPWVTSLDAASLAALESITVQNGAGAGAVNIQDGGNSITVDGTVGISGTVTVDTNFDYAEDSVHNSGEVGAFVLAVRNDAGTPLAASGDYIPFTVDANGDLYVTTGRNGSIANGAETAVTNVAAQILAANTARKKYIIQNTGTANIRVGITGVAATTGFRLVPGGSMIVEMPNCPTNAIFAIREGATNSIAFAQETT